ncbi:MAG: hypothetical protein EXS08_08880 [Planctomycetes bacterium]|nr:hypothetical protein [Planctomycetota bacterium]
MDTQPLSLEAIRSRLIHAGYPHPEPDGPSDRVREVSREAQEARAELRDNIIADVWALLDEVEALRAKVAQR